VSKFLCALLAFVSLNVAQAPLGPNQVSILTQSLRWRNIGVNSNNSVPLYFHTLTHIQC
jgi:hypothetical protein